MALTPALKKQSDLALMMETSQAAEFQKVLKQASVELNQELKKLSGSKKLTQTELSKAVNRLTQDLDMRLKDAANAQEQLSLGLQSGQDLVANSAEIPGSSSFFDVTPVLPAKALSLGTSTYTDLISSVTKEFKQKALQEVKVAIAKGESAFEMQKRLVGAGLRGSLGRDGVFRRPAWRAEMIARTTSNDLINRGRQLAYEELDNEFPELQLQKQWVTVGDRRTSNRCRSLSNQIRPLSENYQASDGWTGAAPPSHVNCRSMSVSASNKWDDESEARAAKKTTKGNRKVAKKARKSVNLSSGLPDSNLLGRRPARGLPSGDHWDPNSAAGKKLRKAQGVDDAFRSLSDADGNLAAYARVSGNTTRTDVLAIVTEHATEEISEAELRMLSHIASEHSTRPDVSGGIRWKASKSKIESAQKLGFKVRKETAKTVELQLDDWTDLAKLYSAESPVGLSPEAFARARGSRTLVDYLDEGARVSSQFDDRIKKLQKPLADLKLLDEKARTIHSRVRAEARGRFPEHNALIKRRDDFLEQISTLPDSELESLVPELNELTQALEASNARVGDFLRSSLESDPEFSKTLTKAKTIAADLDAFKDDLLAAVVPNRGHGVNIKSIPGITDEILDDLEELASITHGDGIKLIQQVNTDVDRGYWRPAGYHLGYDGQRKSTLWHEIGHAIESDRGDVADASVQWVISRRTSDVAVPLNDLTGTTAYGHLEKAFPGNFHTPYAGKDYFGTASEVLSLGLQEFTTGEDLLNLINTDRELFEYVVGVLR